MLSAALYVAMGWAIVPHLPGAADALGPRNAVLVLAGGVCYTLGAACYAIRWPHPPVPVPVRESPRRPAILWSYHEDFHALTVVAAALHFAVVADLALRAGEAQT